MGRFCAMRLKKLGRRRAIFRVAAPRGEQQIAGATMQRPLHPAAGVPGTQGAPLRGQKSQFASKTAKKR